MHLPYLTSPPFLLSLTMIPSSPTTALSSHCSSSSVVEQWEKQQSRRGRPGCPEAVFLKAFLIRIREGFLYTTQLRAFLVKHPLLVIDLGFELLLDPSQPYGFDVER